MRCKVRTVTVLRCVNQRHVLRKKTSQMKASTPYDTGVGSSDREKCYTMFDLGNAFLQLNVKTVSQKGSTSVDAADRDRDHTV